MSELKELKDKLAQLEARLPEIITKAILAADRERRVWEAPGRPVVPSRLKDYTIVTGGILGNSGS
jgi:hypothetical protein